MRNHLLIIFLTLLLLVGAALAAEQPFDGTIRPVASSPDTVWFYQNTPVKVAKTEFKGFGFLKDTKGGQADGWVEFDVRGWDRFTAQIGLSDAWPAWQQDGSIIFYVDGQQAGAYMHKRGQTAQAIDIPLTGKSRLKIEIKIFILLATPTLLRYDPATLDVTSTPPGASITIDGQKTGNTTPCRIEVPMPGRPSRAVDVQAELAGYRPGHSTITLTAGAITHCKLMLSPLPAVLDITSTPPGAAVTLDGVPTGKTTPCRLGVEMQDQLTRDVEVTTILAGHQPAVKTQTVTAGGEAACELILLPVVQAPPPPPPTALAVLDLTSTSPRADIALDGVPTGKSTPCRLEIDLQGKPTREVTVTASLKGYKATSEKVTVTAGATLQRVIVLHRAPGVLDITSTPPGAIIMVDNRSTGKFTPCRIEVDMREQATREVLVTGGLPGSEVIRTRVTVEAGATTSCALTLTMQPTYLDITSTPPGASVSIDRKETGKATPCRIEIDMQKRQARMVSVTIVMPGTGTVQNKNLTVQAGQPARCDFPPLTAQPRRDGSLELDTVPPGARISIDGKPTGNTTPCLLAIPIEGQAREVTVLAEMDGYRALTQTLTVNASPFGTARLLYLRRLPAVLEITSTPPGAAITVNGRKSGKTTPCTVEAEIYRGTGQQIEIRAELDGYREATQQLTVASGATIACALTLENMAATAPDGAGTQAARITQPLDNSLPLAYMPMTGPPELLGWKYRRQPVTIAGKTYAAYGHLIGQANTPCNGAIVFRLDGWDSFTALVGVSDEARNPGSVTFSVDGQEAQAKTAQAGTPAEAVTLDVRGKRELKLTFFGTAVLLDPVLTGTKTTPPLQPARTLQIPPAFQGVGFVGSPRNDWLVASDPLGKSLVWNLDDGELSHFISLTADRVPFATPCAVSPDGEMAAIKYPRQEAGVAPRPVVQLLSMRTGERIRDVLLSYPPVDHSQAPIAVSSGGRYLAVPTRGDSEDVLTLLDGETGNVLHTLLRATPATLWEGQTIHRDRWTEMLPDRLAFSRQGETLLGLQRLGRRFMPLPDDTQHIRTWDVRTGQPGPVQTFTFHRGRLHQINGEPFTRERWLALPEDMRLLKAAHGPVLVSCDGAWQAFGRYVQDTATGILRQLPQPTVAVQFTADSKYLVAGMPGSAFHLWPLNTLAQLPVVRDASWAAVADGPAGIGITATFSPDAKFVLTTGRIDTPPDSGDPQPVRIAGQAWDVATGVQSNLLPSDGLVAWTPNGQQLVMYSNQRLMCYDGQPPYQPTRLPTTLESLMYSFSRNQPFFANNAAPLIAMAFSPSGQQLACCRADGAVRVITLAQPGRPPVSNPILTCAPIKDPVLGFSTDERTLTVRDAQTGDTITWDLQTWQRTQQKMALPKTIPAGPGPTALSPDGRLLARGNANGSLTVWNVATGRVARELPLSNVRVITVQFSPRGDILFAADAAGLMKLYKME